MRDVRNFVQPRRGLRRWLAVPVVVAGGAGRRRTPQPAAAESVSTEAGEAEQHADGGLQRAQHAQVTCRSSPHPSALLRPCWRPSERVPARSVPSKPPPGAPGGGFDGTERTGTRSGGRKQGRNSADGCGEDRASE